MTPTIAVIAALGCSLCNGISTVQQKIGADQTGRVRSFDLTFLLRLFKSTAYDFGTFLAFGGYALSLVALRVLPLFLVQSLIAASVVITALGERMLLHKHISRRTYWALSAVVAGLALISVGAVSGRAALGSQLARNIIELAPIPIAVIGLLFVYMRRSLSAIVLAAFGGLAFGNTSTIGRILVYPHPLWKLADNPLVFSLIASAILGQYFFTISLQRATATKSNAVMIAAQTLGPAICGLLFFDDKIRSGFQLIVLLGGLLVILGAATTAIDESPAATI